MHDLILEGGTLVDGTGAKPREADVAIDGGRISAVGKNLGPARRTLDARGKLVTPGFVDIHTHYDGQATWDALLTPSCWHGVTTVVMGNCGVGFAPVRKGNEQFLIGLMEGVEDIPGTALAGSRCAPRSPLTCTRSAACGSCVPTSTSNARGCSASR